MNPTAPAGRIPHEYAPRSDVSRYCLHCGGREDAHWPEMKPAAPADRTMHEYAPPSSDPDYPNGYCLHCGGREDDVRHGRKAGPVEAIETAQRQPGLPELDAETGAYRAFPLRRATHTPAWAVASLAPGRAFWEAVFVATLGNNDPPDDAARVADKALAEWRQRWERMIEDRT